MSVKNHILIVDGDEQHNQQLTAFLEDYCTNISIAESLNQASQWLKDTPEADILLVLVCLQDAAICKGLDFIRSEEMTDIEAVIMSQTDEPERAIEGVTAGASYFFCKPFNEEMLGDFVADLVHERNVELAKVAPGDVVAECAIDQFALLRGSSGVMKKLFRRIRRVAPTNSSVLITGESGTGKELIAESIHLLSNRSDQPFVAINCGAISAELVESELFGHEKGAFTGAAKRHKGVFERAHGGTLFLDEIGEMQIDLQVKLLRVLETKTFRPVGGEADLDVDVRIVAATNKAPEASMEDGSLREDLFFRLAQYRLHSPPLRQRGSDIRGLAQYFLNALNEEQNTKVSLDESALTKLNEHTWPGNVRELRNTVSQGHISAVSVITAQDLPEFLSIDLSGDYLRVSVGDSIHKAERELILATLEANDGDKSVASELLGISLKTLYNRLNDYDEVSSDE